MENEKTQYYPSDLARLLGLGQIVDMHIADDGWGRQVLRITSKPASDLGQEYRTVKAKSGGRASSKSRPGYSGGKSKPKTLKENIQENGLVPGLIGATLGHNREKPQFMKDAGF